MATRPPDAPRRTQADVLRGASIRSRMYDLLRMAIVELELEPGQALSEKELAQRYEVSRTPVREAIIRLAQEGLVEVVPQLGTFVSRISLREVGEVQFIRETLERASLPHAVERFTRDDHKYLTALLDEQEAAGERDDVRGWFAADEELHRRLLEIGEHPKVWPIVAAAKAHLDRVRMLVLAEPGTLTSAHAQHCEIVKQVAAGRLAKADAALRDHLDIGAEFLDYLAERHPDYFLAEG